MVTRRGRVTGTVLIIRAPLNPDEYEVHFYDELWRDVYLADTLSRAVGAVLGAEQLREHWGGWSGGPAVAAGLGAAPVCQVT